MADPAVVAPAADPATAPVVAPAAPAVPVAPVAPVVPVALPEAAPAAPVAPAAPAAAPAADGAISYAPTGDPGLDVALSFVGKLGIGLEDPAMQATKTGDFSLIKAKLATMGDKAQGWEQMVALAEAANTKATEAATAQAAAVQTAVHATAGSEAHWNTVAQWAAANADPAEKLAINAMFDAGVVQARAAAQMLVDLHAKAQGTVVLPKPAVNQPGAGGGAQTSGPLSVREYSDAVRALATKIGSANLNTSPEYAALGRRLAT